MDAEHGTWQTIKWVKERINIGYLWNSLEVCVICEGLHLLYREYILAIQFWGKCIMTNRQRTKTSHIRYRQIEPSKTKYESVNQILTLTRMTKCFPADWLQKGMSTRLWFILLLIILIWQTISSPSLRKEYTLQVWWWLNINIHLARPLLSLFFYSVTIVVNLASPAPELKTQKQIMEKAHVRITSLGEASYSVRTQRGVTVDPRCQHNWHPELLIHFKWDVSCWHGREWSCMSVWWRITILNGAFHWGLESV